MASQEHLQMLNDGDSTSSTSSEDDDDDETSSESGDAPAAAASSLLAMSNSKDDDIVPPPSPSPVFQPFVSAGPAKKRIKLSLNKRAALKLPIKSTPRLPMSSNSPKLPLNNAPKLPLNNTPKLSVNNAPKINKAPRLPLNKAPKLPLNKAPKLPMNGTKRSISPPPPPVSGGPMKKKIKLKSFHDGFLTLSHKPVAAADDTEIKAMVVDSDDGGEDDAIAAVVDESAPAKETAPKKRAGNPVRAIRFPPMSSPGLLIPAVSGIYRETVNENGLTTPSSVFDHAMSLAGYTVESRTNFPHRGSSVKRVVGDMFDSNVKFTLHFPKLVPENLLDSMKLKQDPDATMNGTNGTNGTTHKSLPDRLLDAFHVSSSSPNKEQENAEMHDANGTKSRVRRKLAQFSDMAPLSITTPYPENFVKKRMEYIVKVNEREKAIVDYQEKEEALEVEHEKMLNEGSITEYDTAAPKPDIKIPPIPEPPEPPLLNEIPGIDADSYEGEHPLCFPKGQKHLVTHLDKECFRILNGRYFGLLSNSVADPHFIGPNAPGINGINLSGGAGLATSNTGGGGGASLGGGLLAASVPSVTTTTNSIPAANKSHAASSSKTSTKKTTSNAASSTNGESIKKPKKKSSGPKMTASSSHLRKLVEEGGEAAEKLKTCIIRAAVHASRSGKHGQPFRSPFGEVYPDVSKAFASHAGIKPCNRCKNNKQGAYHCRLRRKHPELDYDGGNSPAILQPLFSLPMDELLCKP